MCIIFIMLNRTCPSPYRCIIASNRDEYFHRPSRNAMFWPERPGLFAGADMTNALTDGPTTWLGISRWRRLALLTNRHVGMESRLGEKSRGLIPVNYLLDPDVSVKSYGEIVTGDSKYGTFNLLYGELGPDGQFGFTDNVENKTVRILHDGVYALGNSELNSAVPKVIQGKEIFCRTLEASKSEEEIVDGCFKLLNHRERLIPRRGSDHSPDDERRHVLSSVFIWLPDQGYGTRCSSVVLVDKDYNVTFVERTVKLPVNPVSPVWETRTHRFRLD